MKPPPLKILMNLEAEICNWEDFCAKHRSTSSCCNVTKVINLLGMVRMISLSNHFFEPQKQLMTTLKKNIVYPKYKLKNEKACKCRYSHSLVVLAKLEKL